MNGTMKILSELEALAKQLPEEAIRHCAGAIADHKRVFVHGAGRSGLMLRALAMRLAQMGKTVYVAGETITPAIGPGDLLVLASASGNTHSVCHYARIADAAGADLLVITASPQSTLAQLHAPEVLIPSPSKEDADSSQIMGSLFEQMLLILGDAIVQQLAPDAQQMRKRHANLE